MAPTVSAKAGDASGQNWDRMMAAAQVGDANAYRTLLAELALWLRRYYARRLPPAMTEDVVQDVLLAIHEKRTLTIRRVPSYRGSPQLRVTNGSTGCDLLRRMQPNLWMRTSECPIMEM